MKFIDLTGQQFTRWTVLSRAPNAGSATCWNCVCECGSRAVVNGNNLRRSLSMSCGCLAREVSSENARIAIRKSRQKRAARIEAEARSGLRACNHCKRRLPASDFCDNTRNVDGKNNRCRECEALFGKRWRQRYPDRKAEAHKDYYRGRGNYVREKSREYGANYRAKLSDTYVRRLVSHQLRVSSTRGVLPSELEDAFLVVKRLHLQLKRALKEIKRGKTAK